MKFQLLQSTSSTTVSVIGNIRQKQHFKEHIAMFNKLGGRERLEPSGTRYWTFPIRLVTEVNDYLKIVNADASVII